MAKFTSNFGNPAWHVQTANGADVTLEIFESQMYVNGHPIDKLKEFGDRPLEDQKGFMAQAGDQYVEIFIKNDDIAEIKETLSANPEALELLPEVGATREIETEFNAITMNGEVANVAISDFEILVNGQPVSLTEVGHDGTNDHFKFYAMDEDGQILQGQDGMPLEIVVPYDKILEMDLFLSGTNDVINNASDTLINQVRQDRAAEMSTEAKLEFEDDAPAAPVVRGLDLG